MSIYGEERQGKRASDEVMKLALDKYRNQFMYEENQRRIELRSTSWRLKNGQLSTKTLGKYIEFLRNMLKRTTV